MVGSRALYFVLAPTLAIYATTNWDLIAVAFATGATLAYLGDATGGRGSCWGSVRRQSSTGAARDPVRRRAAPPGRARAGDAAAAAALEPGSS